MKNPDGIFAPHTLSSETIRFIENMPKIELHVHLEGATDAATFWEMAVRNGVSLPAGTLEEWESIFSFRDFDHFLEIYLASAAAIRNPDDYALMTERFIRRQAQQNVRYCEVFLSASYLVDRLPWDELIAALKEGAERGEALYGTRLRFIPDIGREKPETRFRVLDFVCQGAQAGIFIGLGLGGREIGNPPEPFADVFAEARRHGLHVVAHAGETGGPESVRGALDALEAERIGHGIRAAQDPALLAELRRRGTPLEVCPHSNYRLGLVSKRRPHPLRELLDAGVFVTVNSDDPPMFSTDLVREYRLLAGQGFTPAELWDLNRNALEASFLPEREKSAYRTEWQAFSGRLEGTTGAL